jgi:hypothetical protein
MSTKPESHVYIRDDVLFADGTCIHLNNGSAFELEAPDRAVLDCVHRAESEINLLCRSLSEFELGGDPQAIRKRLYSVFSDPRSILELGPPRYTARPDVIVCDFNSHTSPISGRALVRELRRYRRVLFLGLRERVASSSPDSFWLERWGASDPCLSWFRFVQWARSIIRFHSLTPLILLGHRDAILFGDLVAKSPSVVVLDPQWPSNTGSGDILGEQLLPIDLIGYLRALYYSLRFTPFDELMKLNRNASSAFGAIEMHALIHADVLCVSRADQIAEIDRVRPSARRTIPFCLPAAVEASPEQHVRTLLLVAGMECGATPLVPILTVLERVRRRSGLFDRIAVVTGDNRWVELVATDSGLTLVAADLLSKSASCTAVLIFPGLLRDIHAAAHWMTSRVPTQIVRSARGHPLQEGLEPVMFLGRVTVESVQERLVDLMDASSAVRRDVLNSQARLARSWSVISAVDSLPHGADSSLCSRNAIPDSGKEA